MGRRDRLAPREGFTWLNTEKGEEGLEAVSDDGAMESGEGGVQGSPLDPQSWQDKWWEGAVEVATIPER